MLKKCFFTAWLLLLLAGGCMAYLFLNVRPADTDKYESLLASSRPDVENSPILYSGTQQRCNVTKDIWYSPPGSDARLHVRIRSGQSQLAFDSDKHDIRITEHMRDIVCVMQEELYYLMPSGEEVVYHKDGRAYYRNSKDSPVPKDDRFDEKKLRPMQQVRYLKAQKGTYDYTKSAFNADEVTIMRFALPGHDLVESLDDLQPMMTGLAQRVKFRLGSGSMNFTASHFKAVFHSAKGGML